jgi:hypothetical protein
MFLLIVRQRSYFDTVRQSSYNPGLLENTMNDRLTAAIVARYVRELSERRYAA